MTLSIMQSIVMVSVQLCRESFMLSVIYKPYMMSVIMLSAIMLSVVMLNVVAPFKLLQAIEPL